MEIAKTAAKMKCPIGDFTAATLEQAAQCLPVGRFPPPLKYKSNIAKFQTNIIAITPATESVKACLASRLTSNSTVFNPASIKNGGGRDLGYGGVSVVRDHGANC